MLKGGSLIALFVCISQAPQNAEETWYTLEWGKHFADMCPTVSPMPKVSLKKTIASTEKEMKELKAEIEKAN